MVARRRGRVNFLDRFPPRGYTRNRPPGDVMTDVSEQVRRREFNADTRRALARGQSIDEYRSAHQANVESLTAAFRAAMERAGCEDPVEVLPESLSACGRTSSPRRAARREPSPAARSRRCCARQSHDKPSQLATGQCRAIVTRAPRARGTGRSFCPRARAATAAREARGA
jgi:hypothetical protein